MSNCFLLHVDTASPLSNNSNDVSLVQVNGNPFDIVYNFKNIHRNVTTVALRSVEMPIGFYNIRAPFNSFTLSQPEDGYVYDLSIPEGYYSDINVIVNALNNIITGLGTPTSLFTDDIGTFFVYGTLVGFTSNGSYSGTPVLFSTLLPNLQPNILSLIGFKNNQTTAGVGIPMYALSAFRTSFDDYVTIYMPYFRSSSSEPFPISFKVQVKDHPVVFYTSGMGYEQLLINTDTTVRLQSLAVQVHDRFGNLLNNNGLDWSFTIEITSDN